MIESLAIGENWLKNLGEAVSQRMSDSEEHNHHGTEMRNVTEGPAKPKGCCARHPHLCCSCLVVVLILAASVGALLGAFFAVIQSRVDKAIGEVCEIH